MMSFLIYAINNATYNYFTRESLLIFFDLLLYKTKYPIEWLMVIITTIIYFNHNLILNKKIKNSIRYIYYLCNNEIHEIASEFIN